MDTLHYIKTELTHPSGGFYAAQDADIDGHEGKFYTFTPDEIIQVLGKTDGEAFCHFYDITKEGNFEGGNIPNLLKNPLPYKDPLSHLLPKLYAYRKNRYDLHKDDKILTAWNGLMIAALVYTGRILNDVSIIEMAKTALIFIENNLIENDRLYTSWRDNKRGVRGFLDDYAYLAWAYTEMFFATCDSAYRKKALDLIKEAARGFFDETRGGFYLNGKDNEKLITQVKETYDGALPSGNAVMAYNMVLLDEINPAHMAYMNGQASAYPAGNTFYLLAVLARENPPYPMHCMFQSS
jgi:hypothetical protein